MATKKDIIRAREQYWLKQAQGQLGTHIKSLKEVEIEKPIKFVSLGERLSKKARKYGRY